MWLIVLSDQLPFGALVSRYLTNKLMGRRLVIERPKPLTAATEVAVVLCGISGPFEPLSPTRR